MDDVVRPLPLRIARMLGAFVLVVVIALGMLWIQNGTALHDAGAGCAEGARRLFLFMDVGLGIQLVWLVVAEVRAHRAARPGTGGRTMFTAALVGVMGNLLVVIAVGTLQDGAVPVAFVEYAVQAGIAVLIGALLVVGIGALARRART